jgi:transposase
MAGKKLQLGRPEVAAGVDEKYAKEREGWRKSRLLAVKLAAAGEYTSSEVADLCGISRGHLFVWLKIVREEGLEALLSRQSPGPSKGTCRGVDKEVLEQLNAKLESGELVTAVAAQRWLEAEHQLRRPYATVWKWLKKLGGVLMVPRPSHSKKDPSAAQEFRKVLAERLQALGIEAGSRVKLWVMDEARFGLHTEMRRLWAKKGSRPVVTRQIKYEWDYLYGSLDIVGGQAHFCQIPGVNLAWDRCYLEDLAATHRQAIHVLIRDQAGFHLRDGDARLPDNVRIIDLPPYSPELNACEHLWDQIKDEIGNRTFESVETLREAMLPALERWWKDPGAVLRLIGRSWLLDQANASLPIRKSY